jgi:hypothetical protein
MLERGLPHHHTNPYLHGGYMVDGATMLRTDVLARMLIARLHALGPMTEAAALEALDVRAPGRGPEVIAWAKQAGMLRRVQHDEPMLEAAGAPVASRSRA